MKVIRKDSFDRETVDDVLVCENINEHYGSLITKFLNNAEVSLDTPDYYILVEDDYKLYKFEI